MRLAGLLGFSILSATTALAQSRPAAELFGTIGVMREGGDEGSNGSAAVYGGAATISFARRWALDVPVLASRPDNYLGGHTSLVMISPGLQYRRGTDKALWFIAFGAGYQSERGHGTVRVGDASGAETIFPVDYNSAGLTIHWRTGAIFNPTGRLLIRSDFFWAHRYVLPNIGVAVSVGVRLGK